MKSNILLVLLFFLVTITINGQTQEATTSDGKKIILNADGTWKYAEEDRMSAEQQRQSDIINRSKNALANSKNAGTNSTSEGISGGQGNQGVPTGSLDSKIYGPGGGISDKGISYNLQGRAVQKLPTPKYEYSGDGKVVVEVSVDRQGKVIQAIPGIMGSTTLDDYLLRVAKEAALKATFEVKNDAPAVEKGTITYNFIIK